MTDFVAFKERQQQAWSTGDFGIIARSIVIVGELLCEAVDLRPGQQVLDVATGTGNTALAAARRGCEVIGLDWAAPLLMRGRERAAAERLSVTFREGNAEQLPFPTRRSMRSSPRLAPCMPPTTLRQRASYSGFAAPGGKSA